MFEKKDGKKSEELEPDESDSGLILALHSSNCF